MKKLISIFVTLLFFALAAVFTLQITQDDANADFSLSEVAIMALADEDGGGDDCEMYPHPENPDAIWNARNRFLISGCRKSCDSVCNLEGGGFWPW